MRSNYLKEKITAVYKFLIVLNRIKNYDPSHGFQRKNARAKNPGFCRRNPVMDGSYPRNQGSESLFSSFGVAHPRHELLF